jgi:hypothetical protein
MPLTAPSLFNALARADCQPIADDLTPAHVSWLIDTGMGPMAQKGLNGARGQLPDSSLQALQAVSLSARFETARRTESLVEVLGQVGEAFDIALLKGILFAQNFYPEPHFRPMGDIDLLVAHDNAEKLAELLLDLGYINKAAEPPEYFETHHHLMPFYHTEKQIWIEVHTGLFPERSGLAGPGPFDPDKVYSRTRKTDFCGLDVLALNKEMQLFHTAVHWAEEFRRIGGMLGLMDIYMLMHRDGDKLNWDWIFSQGNNSAHIAPIQLALGYLERAALIKLPADVRNSLRRQGQLCAGAIRLQCEILDRYVVLGNPPGALLSSANLRNSWKTLLHEGSNLLCLAKLPWRIAFPEDAADRYKLSFQLERFKSFRSKL